MINTNINILAIVVTYYPDHKPLLDLVEALNSQVNSVIIVDNTPAQNDIAWEVLAGLTTLPFGIVKLIVNGAILYLIAFERQVVRLFK